MLNIFLLGCNFSTVNHYKLKEHCRSHTREKIFACTTCGGMFANKAKFVDHVVRQNSSGCKWFFIKIFQFMHSLDVNDIFFYLFYCRWNFSVFTLFEALRVRAYLARPHATPWYAICVNGSIVYVCIVWQLWQMCCYQLPRKIFQGCLYQ